MSDKSKKYGKFTFRYSIEKIDALKELAHLERTTASKIVKEAVDQRLNFLTETSS